MLKNHPPIKFPQDIPPQLIVVIDTEEEFNWSAPPDKNSTSVTAMEKIHRVQDIFDEYDITPCYAIDYPVASQPQGYEPLLEIYNKGNCEIGAHLHPWVNPPMEEKLTISNMYPGNLSYRLEYNKLKVLKEQIKKIFNFSPIIYKAGRSGIGENTSKILEELGFNIDLSICSAFDYTADGGPDFSNYQPSPFFFGTQNQLLEIPSTGAFVGIAGSFSKQIYKAAGYFDIFKAQAIIARLGIVDRLLLSPENFTPKENIKLTKFLFNKGCRNFTWNFHNTALLPGMTTYTKNKKELTQFLDSFRFFFDFFLGEMNGQFSTPTKLYKNLHENN